MTFSQGNSKQVLVGAAAVFVSSNQAALPATLTSDTATSAIELINDDSTNWAPTGYTENGVEVSYEPTYGDVVVDQLLDSAVIFKSGMKVMVNTTFAEATLENLLVTWGGLDADLSAADSDGLKTLDINGGSLGDFPHERGIAFVGPGPRTVSGKTVERIYHIERAIQTQTTAHGVKRDAATTLPVSFRCLPGSPRAGVSQTSYGTVRDRAYTGS